MRLTCKAFVWTWNTCMQYWPPKNDNFTTINDDTSIKLVNVVDSCDLFKSFPIAWNVSIALNQHWLLRIYDDHRQWLLNINWYHVPLELTKRIINIAECIAKYLSTFTGGIYEHHCPKSTKYRFEEHHRIGLIVCLTIQWQLIASTKVWHEKYWLNLRESAPFESSPVQEIMLQYNPEKGPRMWSPVLPKNH